MKQCDKICSIRLRLLVLLVACVCSHFSYAQTNTWTTFSGPKSGLISTLEIDSYGSLLAGNYKGVFRWSKADKQWNKISPDSIRTRYLLALSNGMLFASGGNGLYRQMDADSSWEFLSDGLSEIYPEYQTSGEIIIDESGRLLLAMGPPPLGEGGGIFESEDFGSSWFEGSYDGRAPIALEVVSSNIVLTSTSGCYIDPPCVGAVYRNATGLWESTNFWDSTAGTTYDVYAAISFETGGDSVVVAGTTISGVFRSTDYGSTWRKTELDSVRVVDLARSDNGLLLAGTDAGLFKSIDKGKSWTGVKGEVGVATVRSIVIDSLGRVFVASKDNRIFTTVATRLGTPSDPVITEFVLLQNYPNPFSHVTIIPFSLQSPSHVRLIVLDVLGRRVDVLADKMLASGKHHILWNASNLAGGVYFYQLQSASGIETRKLILL